MTELGPLIDILSEVAGEKPEPVLVGESECDDGVGLFFGEAAEE